MVGAVGDLICHLVLRRGVDDDEEDDTKTTTTRTTARSMARRTTRTTTMKANETGAERLNVS